MQAHRIKEVILRTEKIGETLAIVENMISNLDSKTLMDNPCVLEIAAFFYSLFPNMNIGPGYKLYQRIKQQKKWSEKSAVTFKLYLEDFLTIIQEITDVKRDKNCPE